MSEETIAVQKKFEKAEKEVKFWMNRVETTLEESRQLQTQIDDLRRENEKLQRTPKDTALESQIAKLTATIEAMEAKNAADKISLVKLHEYLWQATRTFYNSYTGKQITNFMPEFRKLIGEAEAEEREKKWR